MKKNILKVLAMLFVIVGIYGTIVNLNISVAKVENVLNQELAGGNTGGGHVHGDITRYSKYSELKHMVVYSCGHYEYKDHDLIYEENSAAKHDYKCSNCGFIKDTDNHDFSYVSKNDEKHEWKCTTCDYVKNTYDHDFEYDSTRTPNTSVHYKKCKDCGKIISEYHDSVADSTKSTALYHYFKCSICNYSGSDYKAGHKYETGSYNCSECGYLKDHKHYFTGVNTRCKVEGCTEFLQVTSFGAIDSLPNHTDYGVNDGANFRHVALGRTTITMSHIPYADADGKTFLSLKLLIQKFNHGNWAAHANAYAEHYDYKFEWMQSNKSKTYGSWGGQYKPWLVAGNTYLNQISLSGKTYTIDASNIYGHNRIICVAIGSSSTVPGRNGKLFVRGGGELTEEYDPTPPTPPPGGQDPEPKPGSTPENISVLVAYREQGGNRIDIAPEDEYYDENTIPIGTNYTIEGYIDEIVSKSDYEYVGYKIGTPDEVPTDLKSDVKTGNSAVVNSNNGKEQYVVFIFKLPTPPPPVEEDPSVVIAYRDIYGNKIPAAPSDELLGKVEIGDDNKYTHDVKSVPGYKYVGYKQGNIDAIPLDVSDRIKSTPSKIDINTSVNKKQYLVLVFEPLLIVGYRDIYGEVIEGLPDSLKDVIQGASELKNPYKPDEEKLKELGYKYVGYENDDGTAIPNKDYDKTNPGKEVTIPKLEKPEYLVFVFEPTIIIGYRDINGNKIEGAPEDVIYGASEIKNPYKPDLVKLDDLYYRYKGYEPGDGPKIPTSFGKLTESESYTAPKLTKPKYLVYVFEPIKITIKHLEVLSDKSTQLITNGDIKFIFENILLKDIYVEGGDYYQKNVSLDKTIYIEYTLLNHTLKNKDRNIATKEYDIEGMYDLTKYDLNKTTTINNMPKINQYGSEVHKKLITILKDPKEKVGYRSDYVLEFVYNRLKLNVEHLIFEALPEDVFLKDVTGSAILTYQKYYDGLTIDALVGQGTNLLTEINKYYNITGRYLRKMVLVANDNIKEKEFIIHGNITPEEALWKIDSIVGTFGTEVNSWLAAEQAKTGSITVKFYYEKIPTLVVKHEDEGGSKLLPNEYIPMVNETTEAESEDLTDWGYDYIEYKPDGKKDDPSEIISEDPRKEKVEVGRVYDDDNEPQDREVIFVYGPNGYTKDDEEFPTGNETKESVILRSNKRDDEEYNVDIAIPTSEDLYANVITDAFLLDRKITNIEKTETIKVKLVSDNGIPCDYFDVDLEYEYLGVKDVVLKVLDKAIVKNNVLNYNIEIPAKYSEGYKHPKLEYKEGGILAEESFDNKKFLNAVNLGGTWYVDFDIENVNDEAEMKKLKESYQKDPTYLMEYITIPTDKLYVKYNGENINENIKVMNRVFLPILGDYGVTEKVTYNTKTGTKVVDLSKEIDTFLESKLVNKDVLFANKYQNGSGIYVKTKMENTVDKSNTTYADIYYKDYQKLEGNKITDLDLTGQESKLVKENVQGNDVVVHTPVVNKTKVSSLYSEIKNDNPYDQWVTRNTYEKTNGAVATLVLGKQFTLTIPHKGNHADYSGYGNEKNYNYKGLINNGNEEINNKMNTTHDHFAMGRDVKFSFGVIRCDKSKKIVGEYIAPNTWIRLEELGYALSDESFNFIIPEWEKELWYSGKHTIETRVFAENCPQTIIDNYLGKADLGSNSSKANKNWNKDKVHYIATDTLKVNVIGEIMDLEFRGTNDPGWSQIDTSIGNEDLALGQAGQNVNKGYKTGVKLGYTAYFDITTTGWTGDTTDSIKIIPNYYYVKKGTTTPVKTELYYKPTPSSGYVKLSENPIQLTTIMNQDCYKGRNYVSIFARYIANSGGKFAMDAGRELSNTARILSGGSLVNSSSILKTDGRTTVNYSSAIKTGTSSEIRLPYSTRLVYQRAIEALDEKYGMELPKVAGTDYCIGHWYGALRLPGTTTTNPDNPGEDDGYIIVTLDDVISEIDNPDPTKPPISYLETDPESINYDNDGDGDPEDPDGKDPDGNGPGGNPDGNDPGGDPDGDPDGNDPGGRPGVGNPDVDIDGDGIPDDPIFTPDNRPIFKPEKGFPGIIFETIPGRVDNEVAGTH